MSLPARSFAVVPITTTRRTKPAIRKQAADEKSDQLRIKGKIDQANAIMDALELRQAALQKQIVALQKRKARACARYERIEQGALREMAAIGRIQLDGFHTTLTSRPATPAVCIVDETVIPEEFLKIEEKRTPVKALIKAALDAGRFVAGVSLAQTISLIRR